jgi:hypothetical protein
MCCGNHNHQHNQADATKEGQNPRPQPGPKIHWMQFVLIGGLIAYVLMYFLRK